MWESEGDTFYKDMPASLTRTSQNFSSTQLSGVKHLHTYASSPWGKKSVRIPSEGALPNLKS